MTWKLIKSQYEIDSFDGFDGFDGFDLIERLILNKFRTLIFELETSHTLLLFKTCGENISIEEKSVKTVLALINNDFFLPI